MNKGNRQNKAARRSAVAIAMQKRYGRTTCTMKDRRRRREGDARRDWAREEW
jgi:hypothetical protein